ncbi:MAG: ATP/GTP-binding protein [Halothiobacillaceae bacterium]
MALLLNNLEIDGFRGLNRLKIEKLGRVNLLVGRNNSGKTRVLDAIRVLSERASPLVMAQISKEHDEYYDTDGERIRTSNADFLRYFFNDRSLPTLDDEKTIRIGDGERIEFKIHYLPFIEDRIEEDERTRLMRRFISPDEVKSLAPESTINHSIVSTHIDNNGHSSRTIIAVIDDETNELTTRSAFGITRRFETQKNHSFKFIPSSFVDHEELANLWDRIVLSDKEASVIEMMKTIDPNITGLAFIGEGSRRDRHPVLRMTGNDPVPLVSLGDGVYRVFQLALNLVNAQDGFLLIDEFENGLHYSTQMNIWKFIFDFSKKLEIQVFATTHNSDCITAFAEAATNHPELGCAYHLGKSLIDGTTLATRYEENRLKELVNLGRDIR